MRVVVAGALGFVTAVLVWLSLGVIIVFVGGTECGDRGSCNWLGDAAATHGYLVAAVVTGASLAAGALVARSRLRRSR
jgi:hypothetical protein